jgi:hypothetical protein
MKTKSQLLHDLWNLCIIIDSEIDNFYDGTSSPELTCETWAKLTKLLAQLDDAQEKEDSKV